jgi:site-specific DNA-cytosine methylase
MEDNLRNTMKLVNCFNIGTICSGSEVGIYACETLAQSLALDIGVPLCFNHSFSCEIVPWKRDWARRHFNPTRMFGDAKDMSVAKAVDLLIGEWVDIPNVHILCAGFECDSVSFFNNTSAEYRGGCVEKGEGKTGRTAQYNLAYIRRHRPLLVILENVVALAFKMVDLQTIIDALEEVGYLVRHVFANSRDFGIAQSRERIYIIGVLFDDRKVTTSDESPQWFHDIFTTFTDMKVEAPPLGEFLAPSDHVSVASWRAERTANLEARDCSRVDRKYEVDHMDAFIALGMDYPPDMGDFTPTVSHLPRRQAELAFLYKLWNKDEPKETVHDLNMSPAFGAGTKTDECATLVSTSRPWLRKLERDMSGDEALVLQGFDYCRQYSVNSDFDSMSFSHSQKLDLAGNAFNAYVFGPLLFSAISHIDFERAVARRSMPLYCAGSSSDGGSESGVAREGICEESMEEEEPTSDAAVTDEDF